MREVWMTNFNLILFEPYIREEVYLLKTFLFLSLFKMRFQSKHPFSYDSNLILRNLLFISFGKSLSKSSNNEPIVVFEWLSSEFHLGYLIFWASQVCFSSNYVCPDFGAIHGQRHCLVAAYILFHLEPCACAYQQRLDWKCRLNRTPVKI